MTAVQNHSRGDEPPADHPYVEQTPGVGGGYPQLRGTRIPVRSIVNAFLDSGSVEATAALYGYVTTEQVLGVLEYYLAYPRRVDEDTATNSYAGVEFLLRRR